MRVPTNISFNQSTNRRSNLRSIHKEVPNTDVSERVLEQPITSSTFRDRYDNNENNSKDEDIDVLRQQIETQKKMEFLEKLVKD